MSEGKWTKGAVEYDPKSGWILSTGCCDRGPMHIADIRGWGHLTGKGHGAHGMNWDDAKAIQDANAALIAEAFNVANETGMTPREIWDYWNKEVRETTKLSQWNNQLADRVRELEGALEHVTARFEKQLLASGKYIPRHVFDKHENAIRRARTALHKDKQG